MTGGIRCPQPGLPDANPGVRAGETAFRAAYGRYTVDIVQSDAGLLAVAGDGVGRPPVSAVITPGTVAALLEAADIVDERSAWRTQAWPLAVDGDQEEDSHA